VKPKNISRGGLFLEAEVLPDPNAVVDLVLDLTENLGPEPAIVNLKGRVVRLMTVTEGKKSFHQIAIQFFDVTPQIQLQLDRYYQELSA